jgi:hypothetical protein
VEARLSEPPETRRFLEQQAKADLVKAGADEKSTTVTILSAYKQGYSWLYDVVRPAVTGKDPDAITDSLLRNSVRPAGWKQQGMFVPARWLLEIYPIDEVLAKAMNVDRKRITFEMAPGRFAGLRSDRQESIGLGNSSTGPFEPKMVERPFFDRFPGLRACPRYDRLVESGSRRQNRCRRSHRDRPGSASGITFRPKRCRRFMTT